MQADAPWAGGEDEEGEGERGTDTLPNAIFIHDHSPHIVEHTEESYANPPTEHPAHHER